MYSFHLAVRRNWALQTQRMSVKMTGQVGEAKKLLPQVPKLHLLVANATKNRVLVTRISRWSPACN